MKSLITFAIFSLILSCKGTEKVVTAQQSIAKEESSVLCIVTACNEKAPLGLYAFNGIGFDKLSEAKQVGKDSFLIKAPLEAEPGFYYIGVDNQQKRPVIFHNEKEMLIRGSCKNMRGSKVIGSKANQNYDMLMTTVKLTQQEMRLKGGEYRKAQKDPEALAKVKEAMAKIDHRQLNFLDSLKKADPFIAKIAALNTYLNFPTGGTEYDNEVDYFSKEFFQFVDLKDAVYNRIPTLFEAFKSYSQTMASVGFDAEKVNGLVEEHLQQIPEEGHAYRYALGGVLIGLQAKNHPSFSGFAKQFIEKYEPTTDSNSIKRLKSQLNQSKSFVTGSEAPEITQQTPDGESLSLSDLRGKVVLIDFWASWCGPCRKENPNVVRMYEKYKDKGFDILGVSLDRTKDRWVQAIEKDGLEWHHISDLKGWKNEAAQTYAVRSIPHTVLVDREGNIIARNLRGNSLERKLKKILEE